MVRHSWHTASTQKGGIITTVYFFTELCRGPAIHGLCESYAHLSIWEDWPGVACSLGHATDMCTFLSLCPRSPDSTWDGCDLPRCQTADQDIIKQDSTLRNPTPCFLVRLPLCLNWMECAIKQCSPIKIRVWGVLFFQGTLKVDSHFWLKAIPVCCVLSSPFSQLIDKARFCRPSIGHQPC